MAKKTIDFDRAWAEHARQQTPPGQLPDIKMLGQTFPQKAEVPAAITLWMGRAASTADEDGLAGEMDLQTVVDLLLTMVPGEVLNQWVNEGRSEPELRQALLGLVALYNGVTPDEGDDASGEGAGPASPGKSSKAGPRSKRTSNASTGKTSTG